MPEPAPTILRKGAVVRVPATGRPTALAYVDLRFADGHVERWLGSGRTGVAADDPVAFGTEVIDDETGSLAEEVGDAYGPLPARAFDVPVEIVVEWG